MRFKQLLSLFLVLTVLLVWAGAKKIYVERRDKENQKSVRIFEKVLPGFDEEAVRQLSLSYGDSRVLLVREESGEWLMQVPTRARAQKSSVDAFLKSLVDLKGEFRSDSSDLLGEYLLSDEKALLVEWFDGEKKSLGGLRVGAKRGASGRNFVRLPGSVRVFSTVDDLLSSAGARLSENKLDPKKFINFRMLSLNAATIRRIELLDKWGSFTLTRGAAESSKPSLWKMEPPAKGEIDEGAVSRLISRLSGLYGQEVLDGTSPASQAVSSQAPWIRVYSAGEGRAETETVLRRGGLDRYNKSYVIRIDPDGIYYEASATSVEAIPTDRDGFLKKK